MFPFFLNCNVRVFWLLRQLQVQNQLICWNLRSRQTSKQDVSQSSLVRHYNNKTKLWQCWVVNKIVNKMQTEEWQLIWQCLRDLTGTFKYLVKSEKDERKEIMRLLRELQKVHHKSDGLGSCIRYVNINIFTRNKSSSVAERFSWLLTENNNSGVIEGLKNTYRFKRGNLLCSHN